MKYLLDTDHISILQQHSGPDYTALSARMAAHNLTDFALPIISFHEQALGANNLIRRARTTMDVSRGYSLLLEIVLGFRSTPVLPFDASAGSVFDSLRAQRIRVGTMDLRIAAIALAQGLIVLTRNLTYFSKVPGLVCEDWTK